jgi:hypothetical protein
VLTIELPASSWAAAVGLSPGFPALTSVSPSSMGTLWGQTWGQLWTAIYRADEEDSSRSMTLVGDRKAIAVRSEPASLDPLGVNSLHDGR